MLALLLAAAVPQTPVEAERAFAADAAAIGQWTAFRKWSTDDATMFVPQPANAHAFLKDRKDPPKAIDWWPTASYVSCDGSLAVNTGGWKRPDGSVGYFTTVWKRQADGGWRWVLDHGDELTAPRIGSKAITVKRASCARPILVPDNLIVWSDGSKQDDIVSKDGTLHVTWDVEANGARTLWVRQARSVREDGKQIVRLDQVLYDNVAAPKP